MKHNIESFLCRQGRKMLMLSVMLVCSIIAKAQITQVHGVVSDDFGPLMGATICEIDANGRIIESTVTDMNGNFSMKVKNSAKDKLRISYVGLKTQTLKFDKASYEVVMASATTLGEVVVKSKRRAQGNGLPIPENEISYSAQGISAKDFEGLGINSIDEAMQGRIAGLDLVGNSGDIGSGSTMRLRGATSLSSGVSQNPLIVVDGNIREVDLSSFDANSSNMNEQMAQLLNINTEDIEGLEVKIDGAGCAIYGSQGSNGVIEIRTKRGKRGKPTVTYSLTLRGAYQPKGLAMLNGDDYTMLLKEAYFNPKQDDAASNIPEINYDPTFSEFQQYNNNTDWRDAVTRWGLRQNHKMTISGGGEKAAFYISAGYDTETGTMIKQDWDRFSTRVNLDYTVSSRIRVQTNFAMTYTKYHHNYEGLLANAQKKMPNMSIYEQDPITGIDTDKYYNMIQSGPHIGSEIFKNDQRNYSNPVAVANLAKNNNTQYDLTPELVLNYELLGMDEDSHRLRYRGAVYMNVFNNYTDKFYPSELVSTSWQSGHNTAYEFSSKRVSFTTKHDLTFMPSFRNKAHSAMAKAAMELSTGSSSSQNVNGSGLPSGGIESPNAGGLVTGIGSDYNDWKSLYFTFLAHYAYKERYIADFSARADGTTKLGKDRHWVYIPAVSARWNVYKEPFMQSIIEKGTLSLLALRASWSYGAQQPGGYFLYTSQYRQGGSYLGMNSMYPANLRLGNLQCERITHYNFGLDVNFFNDRLTLTVEAFNNTRNNMLMGYYRIPSNSGFSSVGSYNTGKMRNTGWDVRLNTNNLIKIGKFGMDMYMNFSNARSRLLDIEETVLKNMNSTFNNVNNQILNRVQIDNPLNAIYGFRSLGVYEYQYETIKDMTISDAKGAAEIPGWVNMSKQEKQQAWLDKHSAPVAKNADGQIIRDDNGDPIRMKFAYSNDGTGVNGGEGYNFHGGDAIYEDVNHDGQINALDIMYLGSSLPKLTGGFGFTFTYNRWRLTANFNYRIGVDIINRARLDTESMSNNNNQSQAVNYRWRKEGDVTSIPRAMYGASTNYNTLISDRFVEDGSYLRMGFLQLNYAFTAKQLKNLGLKKLSMYVSADNLLVITKYKGVDPDISASGYSPAIDGLQTPRARAYTLGVSVGF